VGGLLEKGRRAIIVYESTVYPGVTEEVCGPLLEEVSGLACGTDFFLGYSPERINPGDREHSVDRIVKVIAGQNEEVTERLATVYGAVTEAGVFRAASIKAAEAAKVIENAQRDINIAFMNEITQIFARLDLSIWDVLDAAGTKWNFLKFQPGLVGGHCIGVDPYYLSYRAQQLGHDPDVILAGRSTNDRMGRWVADRLHEAGGGKAGSVLVLGLTFKEDVPDLRNSKVIDVVRRLEALGHEVTVHDPRADPGEARHEYGVELDEQALERRYDIVLAAVPHAEYRAMTADAISRLAEDGGCIADLKGIWRALDLGPDIARWSL
jgi:UDP-N-acetyl-D-galactosamine dehydrogenase